jgi:hypothetical protein
MYMLYESKSVRSGQGDIGAAVSHDGGHTFHHLAVVLDEPWHLSYPFLVQDNDQVGASLPAMHVLGTKTMTR